MRFNYSKQLFALAAVLALVVPLLLRGCGLVGSKQAFDFDRVTRSRKALQACRALAGYGELRKSFVLEEANLGLINSAPESLFVQLRSTEVRTIDAAWWWNPLFRNKPSLDWHDFLASYARAERSVSMYSWLSELKALPGGRSLEVHLVGKGIARAEVDLNRFFWQAWKHAGMAGQPAYRILARRGRSSWVELLFSDNDDRAFVHSTSIWDPNPQCDLDRLAFHQLPQGKQGETYSQYAVVERSGQLRVETFVLDER